MTGRLMRFSQSELDRSLEARKHDGAIFEFWMAGCDTLAIARELRIPESIVYNRLFHARELERREAAQ